MHEANDNNTAVREEWIARLTGLNDICRAITGILKMLVTA